MTELLQVPIKPQPCAVKRLVKFATALLIEFLCHLFLDGLQGDFSWFISRLNLRLGFILPFQHGVPDVVVERVQIWRVSINPGEFAYRKLCMTLSA